MTIAPTSRRRTASWQRRWRLFLESGRTWQSSTVSAAREITRFAAERQRGYDRARREASHPIFGARRRNSDEGGAVGTLLGAVDSKTGLTFPQPRVDLERATFGRVLAVDPANAAATARLRALNG